MSKAQSERMRALWLDPAYRARMSAQSRAYAPLQHGVTRAQQRAGATRKSRNAGPQQPVASAVVSYKTRPGVG